MPRKRTSELRGPDQSQCLRHLHLLHGLQRGCVQLGALLASLRHTLLRRHGVGALLLLLHVRLILELLLLLSSHVGCLRDAVALHVILHVGGHGWSSGVRLFWRLDGIFVLDAVAVGRLGGVQAGLGWCQYWMVEDVVGLDASYLDEVLALGLGDERLQLGGGEGVDQSGLGDDEQEHLGAGEDGQLVCLCGCC